MPPIPFPTPMVGLAVTPKSRGDEAKLSGALHKICEEDPTFRLRPRPADQGNGDHRHERAAPANRSASGSSAATRSRSKPSEPKIPYRETIQANAEGSYRHKKQTGGRGQFGEVHIRMFPLPKDVNIEEWATKARFPSMKDYHYDEENNFLWVDSVVGGTIPSNFLPAVEKGFKERMERGVIAGYKVQNVCVEVHFGKHHPVDSSEQAFKTAGSMAFRNVFQQAKPALLEPIVKIEITVPSGKVGDINSDMSGRRGRVLGMDSAGGDLQTVIAEVPLAEVTTYARSLSSITGGQGSYTHGVQPLRHRARQRAAGDHRQGADEGRGRGVEGRSVTLKWDMLSRRRRCLSSFADDEPLCAQRYAGREAIAAKFGRNFGYRQSVQTAFIFFTYPKAFGPSVG